MRARFAVPMSQVCCHVSRCPRLAWVDKRDARVISRLPLRPMRAGTMMNSSDQSEASMRRHQPMRGQCYLARRGRPANTGQGPRQDLLPPCPDQHTDRADTPDNMTHMTQCYDLGSLNALPEQGYQSTCLHPLLYDVQFLHQSSCPFSLQTILNILTIQQ